MAEGDLIDLRRRKLEQLEAAGVDAFPNGYRVDATIHAVRARYEADDEEQLVSEKPRTRIAGRCVGLRSHGRSGFIDLSDGKSSLQVYATLQELGESRFEAWQQIDLGDFIGVAGEVFRTRSGELTVGVAEFSLLTKAIRTLPEKWHGLKDTETRYRQRYLDLLANPSVRTVFEIRAEIVRALRAHLESNGFLEAETPLLQPLYGGATARPFVTHHHTLDLDLYLRIAPELYLKRLLVGGIERVYDLNRNFRNEGISRQHNPEFTMLEFYAAYWNYEDMMAFAEELVRAAFTMAHPRELFSYQGQEIDLQGPWRRHRLDDALVAVGGLPAETVTNPEALATHLAQEQLPVKGSCHGELLETALDHFVKPQLMAPTYITGFPRQTSPLAKAEPDAASDRVERFELYIGGFEIANGYSELNDPREQRRRMEEQVSRRDPSGEIPPEVDEDYIIAMEYGLPPAAGIGIGIDRLVMLAADTASIRDVILFPLLRPKL